MLPKNFKIWLIIIVTLITIVGLVLALNLFIIKWVSCDSPFATPKSKMSNVCKELGN